MDLEALLIDEGVAAAPADIRAVLERAERDGAHPVVALVEAGIVAEDVLADVLARACSTVVVDLDGAELDPDAVRLLSERRARELLVLPLAPGGGRLRVAFANPLDRDAARMIEAVSGLPVLALVGTLSAIRESIDRVHFRSHPARRRGTLEMPREITRKVDPPPERSTDTAPLYRPEEDATLEERHDALLLALVERGALTRADYAEALGRLLSRRNR